MWICFQKVQEKLSFITSCVYYNLGKAASKVAKYLCASYVRYQLYWWIAMLVSNLSYISSKIIELNNLNKLLWCIINFLFSPVGWVIFFVTCRWCCSIQNDLLGTDCSASIATVTPADQKTVLHPKNDQTVAGQYGFANDFLVWDHRHVLWIPCFEYHDIFPNSR